MIRTRPRWKILLSMGGAVLGVLMALGGFAILSAEAQTAAILVGWLATSSAIPGLPLVVFLCTHHSEMVEALTVSSSDMGAFALSVGGALLFVTASVLTALQASSRRSSSAAR